MFGFCTYNGHPDVLRSSLSGSCILYPDEHLLLSKSYYEITLNAFVSHLPPVLQRHNSNPFTNLHTQLSFSLMFWSLGLINERVLCSFHFVMTIYHSQTVTYLFILYPNMVLSSTVESDSAPKMPRGTNLTSYKFKYFPPFILAT